MKDFGEFLTQVFRKHWPVIFFWLWAMCAALVPLKYARADPLVIELCGHSTYTCPGDVLSESETSFARTGDQVGGVKIRDSATGKEAVIPVEPSFPLKTPAGWGAPSGSDPEPTPPSTAPVETEYKVLGTGTWYGSHGAACDAFLVEQLAPYQAEGFCGVGNVVSSSSSSCTTATKVSADPPGCSGSLTEATNTMTTQSTCPEGYTYGGGTCTLTDASIVDKPSDTNAGVKRSGNTLSLDSNDPDSAATAGTVATLLNLSASSSTAVAGDIARGGALSVVIGGDGKTTITATKDNGNGTSRVTTVVVGAPDGSGAARIEGISSGTVQGSGSLATGTPTAGTGKDPCGLPGGVPCKMDETGVTDGSGAATRGSQLVTQTNTLKEAADSAVASGDLSTFGLGQFIAPTDDADKLPNPFSASLSCSNPSVDLFGSSVTLGVCALTAPIKTIFEWALYVWVALYAWYRFARGMEA